MFLLEASRSWSRDFNRFLIGALALYFLGFMGALPFLNFDRVSVEIDQVTAPFAMGLIAFFLGSSLLGTLIVPFGQIFFDSEIVGEVKNLERAKHVGSSQNSLLIEVYRDTQAQAELAKGIRGLVFFCFSVSALHLIYSFSSSFGATKISTEPSIKFSNLSTQILGAAVGLLIGEWIKRSVQISLKRIDEMFELDAEDAKKP
ncbi:hypothetical protein [Roseovarius sp. M141]|uniref:hypothetical protein n=1 Tax=Roseovarius sp. M141 TaxID=2583806 RepID=UPI0020CDFD78|nr:hypothetical protein [Roseovarius sp. M141]MCQ0092030.1 hypothetical protein [Roseovarius sp. M141]